MSKVKIPKVNVPRPMVEIQAEYNELRGLAADSQYQVFIYGKTLEQTNHKMAALNQEAAKRKELDAAEEKDKAASTSINP
jgi:hypothetical protein